MKKLVCTLCILAIGCVAHASYWNPSDEVKALRTVKNAKIKMINVQIKEKTEYIQKVSVDDSLSESEKQAVYIKEEQEIKLLHQQKTSIEKQYKKDKRNTKFPWKYLHKKTNNK